MKIGLARHFRIPHSTLPFMNAQGFSDWIKWYDTCEVHALEVPKAGPEWHKCYTSDLPRAIFTAGYLYPGTLEKTPLLREVPFSPLFTGRLRLPLFIWQSTCRGGWLMDHKSQSEGRSQTKQRIAELLDMVTTKHQGENVLLVTHGFFMQFLKKELLRRGFHGRVPIRPKGGVICLFES